MKDEYTVKHMLKSLHFEREIMYKWHKAESDIYWDSKIFGEYADPTKMNDALESLADVEGKIVALQWVLNNNQQLHNYEEEKTSQESSQESRDGEDRD